MKLNETATWPDDVLAGLIRQGDAVAFEEVYNKYAAQLYHAAHAILKDRAACEDIVQELFTNLWIKRQHLHIHHLRSYLFTATKKQRAHDHPLRKNTG